MKIAFELDLKCVVRCLLAALLVWAAIGKIANPHEFYLDVAAYQLPLPGTLLRFVAIVLPWLELLCGILLVAGTARRPALMWMVILFAIFVLATGQAWARGLEISCGCLKLDFLGESAAKIFESVQFAFFRALVLLALGIYLLRQKI